MRLGPEHPACMSLRDAELWSPAELSGRLPADYLFNSMTIEGRPCACGGMVWADPANPAPGVKVHNSTLEHMAWTEAEGEREAWGEEPCAVPGASGTIGTSEAQRTSAGWPGR